MGFRDYDEQFRFRISMNPNKEWSVLDRELWNLYMITAKQEAAINLKTSYKCYDYNFKEDCHKRSCQYLHKCIKSFGEHPQILCSWVILLIPGMVTSSETQNYFSQIVIRSSDARLHKALTISELRCTFSKYKNVLRAK